MLDAPVSGGEPKSPSTARLSIMVGGKKEIFENARLPGQDGDLRCLLATSARQYDQAGQSDHCRLDIAAMSESTRVGARREWIRKPFLSDPGRDYRKHRAGTKFPCAERNFKPGFSNRAPHQGPGHALILPMSLGCRAPHQPGDGNHAALKVDGRAGNDHAGVSVLRKNWQKCEGSEIAGCRPENKSGLMIQAHDPLRPGAAMVRKYPMKTSSKPLDQLLTDIPIPAS